MFTIEQIKTAHSKVKSGADFPKYIQSLKEIGVNAYDNYVSDGHTAYYGANSFQIKAESKYPVMEIGEIGLKEKLNDALRVHQQGQTDYYTFCQQAAEAGVEKWRVDMIEMTCTYYDKTGAELIVEDIPVC